MSRLLGPRISSSVPLVLLAMIGCSATERPAAETSSITDAQRAAIADTLERMIVSAYDLSQEGDKVERLMSLYPPSGPVISASAGMITTSRDTLQAGIRAFWQNVGRNMR